MSSSDSPRNSRITTSILRFADHRGRDLKSSWDSLSTDMSGIVAPLYRLSNNPGSDGHDLRHTHAALLIAQGEHPKVIQERLGHASIRTTLDTYGHLFSGLDEAAAERLDATWLGSRVDAVWTRHQRDGIDPLAR